MVSRGPRGRLAIHGPHRAIRRILHRSRAFLTGNAPAYYASAEKHARIAARALTLSPHSHHMVVSQETMASLPRDMKGRTFQLL